MEECLSILKRSRPEGVVIKRNKYYAFYVFKKDKIKT